MQVKDWLFPSAFAMPLTLDIIIGILDGDRCADFGPVDVTLVIVLLLGVYPDMVGIADRVLVGFRSGLTARRFTDRSGCSSPGGFFRVKPVVVFVSAAAAMKSS